MLITRCPNCETTFRVRMEQLNLRGGRVRCGHCHVPFSALASLEELPEETATTLLGTPPSSPATPAAQTHIPMSPPAVSVAAVDTLPPSDFVSTQNEVDPIAPIDLPPTPPVLPRQDHHAFASAVQTVAPDEANHDGDLDFDIEGTEQTGAQAAEAVHADEAATQTESATDEAPVQEPDGNKAQEFIELGSAEDDAEEFDREFEKNLDEKNTDSDEFDNDGDDNEDGDSMPQLHTIFLDEDIPPGAGVDPAEVAARSRTRRHLILGNVLLLLTGLLLSAFVFRVELTRLYPGLRAPLEQACQYFACDVPYPRDADEVLLVGSDLTQADKAANEATYHLAVTVRNHARYPVAWPQLEITLTDRFERALTRRVLDPKDWLPANMAQRSAFEAQGELTSQITLSSDSQVVGYRLGVFYR
ncbi:MAG: family finger-like protein [Rhodocyclales bacterium]|nr:family finger-like protein [Rhodocyclales bacterium]